MYNIDKVTVSLFDYKLRSQNNVDVFEVSVVSRTRKSDVSSESNLCNI